MHIADYTAHPHYRHLCHVSDRCEQRGPMVLIGDEVAPTDPAEPASAIVVAIYLDDMVELSTGDQVAAADLVLLRRAQ